MLRDSVDEFESGMGYVVRRPRGQRTCESLPMPETGLTSLTPRARTASTATSMAITMEVITSRMGIPNIGLSTAVAAALDTTSPMAHQEVGMAPKGGVDAVEALKADGAVPGCCEQGGCLRSAVARCMCQTSSFLAHGAGGTSF